MAVVRNNILNNDGIRDQYLQGVVLLDEESSGVTAQDAANFLQRNNLPLSMRGIQQDLSTYDLYVFWHVVAMSVRYSVGNAAHQGPIFLPWHRMYLIRLEQELQRVLGDDDFGLPYWDWAEDGELPTANQVNAPIWSDANLGEPVGPVTSGPAAGMRVRLWQSPITGNLQSLAPRPVNRAAGQNPGVPDLPTKAGVQESLDQLEYDEPPWSFNATSGHRNRNEGWFEGPQLHNRVHVWIGGDMSPGTSPNDPAFFLNHCNVDRIWEAWMAARGRGYRPIAGEGPLGHRIDSGMIAILGAPMTPSDVLDPATWYSYDTLQVS